MFTLQLLCLEKAMCEYRQPLISNLFKNSLKEKQQEPD
jgi:hypothetical protein